MRIALIASEIAPLAKTGDLADTVAELARSLEKMGHEVSLFLPLYLSICQGRSQGRYEIEDLPTECVIPMDKKSETARVSRGTLPHSGVQVYFIDNPGYFFRDALYGTDRADYPDNSHRFIFFSRAVLEVIKALDLKLDVINCFDWQTALIPVYLKSLYREFFRKTLSVLTIHNIAYQGLFWHWDMNLTGLGWDYFNHQRLEFFGKLNLLKGGIAFSDAITTLSKRHALEIQGKEQGAGLDGILQVRKDSLFGILNGLNYWNWNPEVDTLLPAKFSAEDLSGKQKCRQELRKNFALKEMDCPLIGLAGPFNRQRGMDLFLEAAEDLLKLDAQWLLMGDVEPAFMEQLKNLASRAPEKIKAMLITPSANEYHLFQAGIDFLLAPSRTDAFNPDVALGMRYGTLPIGREIGSLLDMLAPTPPETEPNGLLFQDYSKPALLGAVQKALAFYNDRPARNKRIRKIMGLDFGWNKTAAEYAKLYASFAEKMAK